MNVVEYFEDYDFDYSDVCICSFKKMFEKIKKN